MLLALFRLHTSKKHHLPQSPVWWKAMSRSHRELGYAWAVDGPFKDIVDGGSCLVLAVYRGASIWWLSWTLSSDWWSCFTTPFQRWLFRNNSPSLYLDIWRQVICLSALLCFVSCVYQIHDNYTHHGWVPIKRWRNVRDDQEKSKAEVQVS